MAIDRSCRGRLESSFGPEACLRFFLYAGATREEAVAMMQDEKVDSPSEHLPFRQNDARVRYSPRDFIEMMETFFSGKLGPEWKGGQDFVESRDLVLIEATSERNRSREDVLEDVIVIGLTGKRRKGKTHIADHMVKHGFIRMHPFNPGKAVLRGFFASLGVSEADALRMTNGDLKDAPCDKFPIDPETGKNYTPRWLMEELGVWMGVDMGPEWTIGTEIDYHMRTAGKSNASKWIMESVVYEAPAVQAREKVTLIGVRSDRPAPGHEHVGDQKTDRFLETIIPNFWFTNRMNGIPAMLDEWDRCLAERDIDYGQCDPRQVMAVEI